MSNPNRDQDGKYAPGRHSDSGVTVAAEPTYPMRNGALCLPGDGIHAPINVRVVQPGEGCGMTNLLTNELDEPLVEFYDDTYPDSDHGELIARYPLSTVNRVNPGRGLALHAHQPHWALDGHMVAAAQNFATAETVKRSGFPPPDTAARRAAAFVEPGRFDPATAAEFGDLDRANAAVRAARTRHTAATVAAVSAVVRRDVPTAATVELAWDDEAQCPRFPDHGVIRDEAGDVVYTGEHDDYALQESVNELVQNMDCDDEDLRPQDHLISVAGVQR